jgi:hypothetical protein
VGWDNWMGPDFFNLDVPAPAHDRAVPPRRTGDGADLTPPTARRRSRPAADAIQSYSSVWIDGPRMAACRLRRRVDGATGPVPGPVRDTPLLGGALGGRPCVAFNGTVLPGDMEGSATTVLRRLGVRGQHRGTVLDPGGLSLFTSERRPRPQSADVATDGTRLARDVVRRRDYPCERLRRLRGAGERIRGRPRPLGHSPVHRNREPGESPRRLSGPATTWWHGPTSVGDQLRSVRGAGERIGAGAGAVGHPRCGRSGVVVPGGYGVAYANQASSFRTSSTRASNDMPDRGRDGGSPRPWC